MKSLRTVRYSLVAAAVAGAAVVSTPAIAGVNASAGIANMYLWRGMDVGNGVPAVSGNLEYAAGSEALTGYAAVWGSSAGPTQEVDVYGGARGVVGGFSYNVAYFTYNYPQAKGVDSSEYALTAGCGPTDARCYDAREFYLSGGIAGVTLEAFIGTGEYGSGGDNKNNYFTLSYAHDKYSAKYGTWDLDSGVGEYSHLDVSYKASANLSFTVSKVVDDDDGEEDDALFVVSYSLPLEVK